MLMSPDSSINCNSVNKPHQPQHHQQQPQSVIRVQVQECSQSITPSTTSCNIFYVNKTESQVQKIKNDYGLLNHSLVQPSQQQQQPQNMQPQPQRPETPEYTKSFPVMDTTVASSMKGEPDLNIGIIYLVRNDFLTTRFKAKIILNSVLIIHGVIILIKHKMIFDTQLIFVL